MTASAGPFASDEGELWESYQKAQAALSAKWLLGKNRLLRDVTPSAPAGNLSARFDERLDTMISAIKEYDLVAIDDCLLRLFGGDVPLASRNEAYELIIRITSRLHSELQTMNEDLYELLKWDSHQPNLLFQFETVHDIVSWLRRRFFELSEMIYVKRQRQKRKLIDSIISYVEDNLEQKLTLKEVAARF